MDMSRVPDRRMTLATLSRPRAFVFTSALTVALLLAAPHPAAAQTRVSSNDWIVQNENQFRSAVADLTARDVWIGIIELRADVTLGGPIDLGVPLILQPSEFSLTASIVGGQLTKWGT